MFTIVSDNIEVLQESPTPGPRPTRGRPKPRPGSNYVTPPEGSMTIVDFSPQPLASTLPHAPGRPSSAAVMRGSGGRPSPYTGAMQVYRPGSAPAPKGYHGVLTPGEHLLAAPHLSTVLTTPGARRPAAEELQYELSVTAAVLRAAQDRLAKEREERQLARVGEELALIDVQRAREEAHQVATERREGEKHLARAMAEQRRALETELRKLESDTDAAAAGMRAEMDAKDALIRQLQREVSSLKEQLDDTSFKLDVASRALEETSQAKGASDQALKEARRAHHDEVRELQDVIASLRHGSESALEHEKRMRLTDASRLESEAKAGVEHARELEREKRIEQLGKVGLKRMLNRKLAMGWSAWHEPWVEKRRRLRLLKAAANRLTRPKLSAAYASWRREWTAGEKAKVRIGARSPRPLVAPCCPYRTFCREACTFTRYARPSSEPLVPVALPCTDGQEREPAAERGTRQREPTTGRARRSGVRAQASSCADSADGRRQG